MIELSFEALLLLFAGMLLLVMVATYWGYHCGREDAQRPLEQLQAKEASE